MTDRDAANLLIAVNVADTARAAPETVELYGRLRASSKTWSSNFGPELGSLISGVRTGTMADSVSSLVRLASERSRLVSRRYDAENYEIEIRFQKPIPGAAIYVAAPRGEQPDTIRFSQRAQDFLCQCGGSHRTHRYYGTHNCRSWRTFARLNPCQCGRSSRSGRCVGELTRPPPALIIHLCEGRPAFALPRQSSFSLYCGQRCCSSMRPAIVPHGYIVSGQIGPHRIVGRAIDPRHG